MSIDLTSVPYTLPDNAIFRDCSEAYWACLSYRPGRPASSVPMRDTVPYVLRFRSLDGHILTGVWMSDTGRVKLFVLAPEGQTVLVPPMLARGAVFTEMQVPVCVPTGAASGPVGEDAPYDPEVLGLPAGTDLGVHVGTVESPVGSGPERAAHVLHTIDHIAGPRWSLRALWICVALSEIAHHWNVGGAANICWSSRTLSLKLHQRALRLSYQDMPASVHVSSHVLMQPFTAHRRFRSPIDMPPRTQKVFPTLLLANSAHARIQLRRTLCQRLSEATEGALTPKGQLLPDVDAFIAAVV